jgi:hypothetical protein
MAPVKGHFKSLRRTNATRRNDMMPSALVCLPNKQHVLWPHRPVADSNAVDQPRPESALAEFATRTDVQGGDCAWQTGLRVSGHPLVHVEESAVKIHAYRAWLSLEPRRGAYPVVSTTRSRRSTVDMILLRRLGRHPAIIVPGRRLCGHVVFRHSARTPDRSGNVTSHGLALDPPMFCPFVEIPETPRSEEQHIERRRHSLRR